MIIELKRVLSTVELCEAKLCPFCGGEPEIKYVAGNYDYYPDKVQIKCKSCGAMIVLEDPGVKSDEKLIKLTLSRWNDRVSEKEGKDE